MNRTLKNPKPLIAAAVVCVLLVLGFAVYIMRSQEDDQQAADKMFASEQTVASFYASLAALDVEENERAEKLLTDAVKRETREPALWANLAVAQMRLNEPDKSAESLRRALDQASDSRELALLNSQILEYSGRIEQAINQLQKLHREWPENVAVTFSLASLLGQIQDDAAEAERISLLKDILDRVPNNLRVLSEQARVAASLGRDAELRQAIDALDRNSAAWPDAIKQYLTKADEEARDGNHRQAALSLTFLQNLLKPRPEYQQSLAQLGILTVGAIGTPLRSPLRLTMPSAETADADHQLTFEETYPLGKAARPDHVLAMEHSGERRSTLISLSDNLLHIDALAALPFPGLSTTANPASVCVADVNSDFHQDLICVGEKGCRIFLGTQDGSFSLVNDPSEDLNRSASSVWPVDIDADGDIDLLLSDDETALRGVRNNGDMTFTSIETGIEAHSVANLASVDFDGDGDVDVVTLDDSGALIAWQNERGGKYVATELPDDQRRIALAIGDIDRSGRMDLITISESGHLRSAHWEVDHWTESPIATWLPTDSFTTAVTGDLYLSTADLDNNGGVDVVASTTSKNAVWLQTTDGAWTLLDQSPSIRPTSIVDFNEDGRLDLVGLSESGVTVALNQSQAGYGWTTLKPLANTGAGDKRINSFGIGGRIEVRAGNLVQANEIDSPRVHFGLGNHRRADVARIIWPNGTVQAEFDLTSGETLVANQRLKGSCPWVFTFDGQDFRFVKDFIWRSPLGLRINAQTTAGVTQTEDWIKIPGDQLAEVDGRYLVRITAELWETHFFDHVSMIAVDHPIDVEVFVDERFVPQSMPDQKVTSLAPPKPLSNIVDDAGDSMDETLRSNDGVYADGFALGEFQGVAKDHWIEFDLPSEASPDQTVMIVGHGWIYPTDSSLNAALDQGNAARPYPLILEQQHPDGHWSLVQENLGFPAGKNKDVLLPIPSRSLTVSRRFRLRTNMEVYWDSLRWSYVVESVEPRLTTLKTSRTTLRYRGYSRLLPEHRRRPDTPVYEVTSTGQRWLDLDGYYTRYGDIGDLLESVDDRYAIVNAGDELVFEFDAIGRPPSGWQRDFVLVGDGWVKDGDLNTAFSQTVLPLPSHDKTEYRGPLVPLIEDAVYQQHIKDWLNYHTRYITHDHFHQHLWQQNAGVGTNEAQP
ncbi:CRTAC1 family protein [Stieleria varia]|uniref:FG-GAP repeat protein n=1 Tax=Stieleria varia TaxID=2528005 RepID=A0A5C6B2U3_9BACT|nr:CRTAC1 family protein [Stieleria varia]TWU06210.1 FG-GAP repeat protein [Stieleria varia]